MRLPQSSKANSAKLGVRANIAPNIMARIVIVRPHARDLRQARARPRPRRDLGLASWSQCGVGPTRLP